MLGVVLLVVVAVAGLERQLTFQNWTGAVEEVDSTLLVCSRGFGSRGKLPVPGVLAIAEDVRANGALQGLLCELVDAAVADPLGSPLFATEVRVVAVVLQEVKVRNEAVGPGKTFQAGCRLPFVDDVAAQRIHVVGIGAQ